MFHQIKMKLYNINFAEPVHGKIRVPKTKWVILRYPTGSMAQSANMSTDAFEDFYFDVCNLDYSKNVKSYGLFSRFNEQN